MYVHIIGNITTTDKLGVKQSLKKAITLFSNFVHWKPKGRNDKCQCKNTV